VRRQSCSHGPVGRPVNINIFAESGPQRRGYGKQIDGPQARGYKVSVKQKFGRRPLCLGRVFDPTCALRPATGQWLQDTCHLARLWFC
jgi:hypothetical protein